MKNKKIVLLIIFAITLISGFVYVHNRDKVYSELKYF